MELTDEQKRRYMLQSGEPAVCPFCHSTAITLGPITQGDVLYRNCICGECHRPWMDVLKVHVIDVIPR